MNTQPFLAAAHRPPMHDTRSELPLARTPRFRACLAGGWSDVLFAARAVGEWVLFAAGAALLIYGAVCCFREVAFALGHAR